jgi:predicted nucleic acid-binding protein
MIYLDTSVLFPLFVPEPSSAAIRGWLQQRSGEVLSISDWTQTEFASAMGIKVRQKGLSASRARSACALFEQLASESLRVLTPSRADYARAAQYLSQHRLGLRAGDALHLAVAAGAGAETVYSLDRRFVAAGRKLKIRTATPI